MKSLPFLIFFLSGASALVFETLWFRQAGLAFGNSVWAASMVLASFMAGLAIGNWCSGSLGHRVRRPFVAYAVLELAIGGAGIGLVLGFPFANEWLLPLLRPALGNPLLLNASRLGLAFCCLLIPTAAMGATLPLMVRGLASREVRFGDRLGMLYAINTFGAMAGTLMAEFFLIERFGVRGTGLIACAGNVLAGVAAIAVHRLANRSTLHAREHSQFNTGPLNSPEQGRVGLSPYRRRILAAAFVAGGALLALEVVWMRFLTLFYFGTSQIFATMLAIVLGGIALGGLVASRWSKSALSDVSSWLPVFAFVSGGWVLAAYLGFARDLASRTEWYSSPLFLAVPMVFPVCVLSGILFTLMGSALHDDRDSETRVTGVLSLFNTLGAMCGAWLCGFVLLPQLGLERTFLALVATYLTVGCLCLESFAKLTASQRQAVKFSGAALALILTLFPHGTDRRLFHQVARTLTNTDPIVALQETATGTVIYTESQLLGEPVSHRLITDGHSMAGTNSHSQRYMKQYVFLPVALHPAPRKACLISFGCGVTARALADTKELTQIDVVDISKDILAMNRVIYPDPREQPLRDPRVRVFVEDGRFHLLSTTERYDLITSEPPPPKAAGVVNLYTREYFQLIHDRLASGGMATYWLPHHSLSQSDSRAIVRAWCDAFGECSLWNGSGDDWMLFGVRDGFQPVTDARFVQQWQSPIVAPTLTACGFESPGLLGATFIGDRSLMLELTRNAKPLVDDFPYRLSPNARRYAVESRYKELLNPSDCRQRFEASEHIRRLFPREAFVAALAEFPISGHLHDQFAPKALQLTSDTESRLQMTHVFLTSSSLKTPVLWSLGSSDQAQRVIDRVRERLPNDPQVLLHLGHRALANREFSQAYDVYSQRRELLQKQGKNDQPSLLLLAYTLCLQGKAETAQHELDHGLNFSRLNAQQRLEFSFLKQEFHLSDPSATLATRE
jgi:predicted membrane-bound spermidine synthase